MYRGIETAEEVQDAYDFTHQTTHAFEERPVEEIINEGDAEGLHELALPMQLGLVSHQSAEPKTHFQ